MLVYVLGIAHFLITPLFSWLFKSVLVFQSVFKCQYILWFIYLSVMFVYFVIRQVYVYFMLYTLKQILEKRIHVYIFFMFAEGFSKMYVLDTKETVDFGSCNFI